MTTGDSFYGRPQELRNWRLAVDLANNWRRMMGVEAVNYPYSGDPRDRIKLKQ